MSLYDTSGRDKTSRVSSYKDKKGKGISNLDLITFDHN